MDHRRSFLFAFLLNLPLPGLGQLYCGRLGLAIAFIVGSFVHWLAFILAWSAGGSDLPLAMSLWYGAFGLVWLAAQVQVYFAVGRADEEYVLKPYNLWYLYLLLVLLVWVGHFGMFKLVGMNWLSSYPLQSDAMSPNLLVGDWIRVDLRQDSRAQLRPGTVVAIRDPYDGQTMRVLRLVALGGQEVVLDETGLSVGGSVLARSADKEGAYRRRTEAGVWDEQRYARFLESHGSSQVAIAEHPDPEQRRSGRWTLADDQVFVLGDNRIHAVDSTVFGPVAQDNIAGVVFHLWFSRDPETGKFRPERKNMKLK